MTFTSQQIDAVAVVPDGDGREPALNGHILTPQGLHPAAPLVPGAPLPLPYWVCHKDKRPINPHTGRAAKTNDPSTWSDYETSVLAARRWQLDGVGYVFTHDLGIVGIDLDKCIGEDGQLSDLAARWVSKLNSYTEISPSGRGLHILVKGTLTLAKKRQGVELYSDGRYFTYTGKRWPGTPPDIREGGAALTDLLAELESPPQGGTVARASSAYGRAALESEIARVVMAREGTRNNALFEAATALFELVNGGELAQMDVVDALTRAAAGAGLGHREIKSTLKSASRTAAGKRRHAPPSLPPARHAPPSLEEGGGQLPPSCGEFRLDDIGNGARFVKQHGQWVRYVHKWNRWLVYDGRHWAVDDNGQVEQLAIDTVLGVYQEAEAAAAAAEEKAEKEWAKELAEWARDSASLSRRRAMLETAKSDPAIATRHTEFDKSPLLLNVQNGVIHLETRKLLPHDPGLLITHCLPVPYDQAATCPRWDSFLARILPDTETQRFVQKAVGYSLSGLVTEQCLFFLYGAGANGKSTFLNVLFALLGGLAAKIRAESLFLKDRDAIPNDIASLTGSRLVVTSELTSGRSLNEAMVKDLTGGDAITARFLHQEYFTFVPSFKIWMYGNHKPNIRGTDDGIWRRIQLIPFTVQIPEHERDGKMVDKLREELPGVLNWALAGWEAYQREGLRPPAAISQATEEYRLQSDTLGQYLADCCIVQEGATCQSKLLHDSYTRWGGTLTPVKFAQAMQERGFSKARDRRGVIWQGVGLLDTV